MRKTLFYVGIVFTISLFLTGCKKNEREPITDSIKSNSTFNFSNKNNILVFNTVNDFTNTVDNLTESKERNLTKFIENLNFSDFFSNQLALKNDLIKDQEMDNILGSLLNTDGVIQIGEHLYKINLKKESVYVISVENKNLAFSAFLNENDENQYVSVYSTGQDVLFLVNGEVQGKCGGISGGSYPCYNTISESPIVATLSGGEVWRLNAGVKFFRSGFYFRLSSLYEVWAFSSESATKGTKINNLNDLFTVEIFCKSPEGWYRKKPCNSGSVGTQNSGFYYSKTNASYQKTFYSGSRNLNGYHFFVQSRAKFPNGFVTQASLYGGRNINSPY